MTVRLLMVMAFLVHYKNYSISNIKLKLMPYDRKVKVRWVKSYWITFQRAKSEISSNLSFWNKNIYVLQTVISFTGLHYIKVLFDPYKNANLKFTQPAWPIHNQVLRTSPWWTPIECFN